MRGGGREAGGLDPVLVERRDAITVLTVNRPEARNAIDLATAQAIEAAVDEFGADDAARVLVLTGAGGTFSAGMDLVAASKGEMPMSKRIIDESPDWSVEEGFAKQGEIALPALFSKDAAEGALAFAQKRDPQWQGR
ncbi:enoyl-CoA hydratase-related protein [Nocardia sp. NBC_01730]|nr:enoyl-CoA hydratase-related protein [Nocardia sp. NBC_01730]